MTVPLSIAEVRGRPPGTPSPSPSPLPSPSPYPLVLCDVCCEHVPLPSLRGCSGCHHRYCHSCVAKYWAASIFSGNHEKLLCMYGGCGVEATNADIMAVVPPRVYRKMIYFRSRDEMAGEPGAKWCATDGCWQFLGVFGDKGGGVVQCATCSGKTCVRCERSTTGSRHVCVERKRNRRHGMLFGVWAAVHTKSCPMCSARIERNHGCSHMTCTRCGSYFCWRCRGFLNNGCPLPGRACVCDRVMTVMAYSGLAVVGVVGSPLIVGGVVVGGVPYVMWKVWKGRKGRGGGGEWERTVVREGGGRMQIDEIMVGDSADEDDEDDARMCRTPGRGAFVLERRRGSVGPRAVGRTGG